MNRARLTLTDVVYLGVALAALAALYPALSGLIGAATGLGRGPELVFQSLLPVALLVLLTVIWVEARGGLAR